MHVLLSMRDDFLFYCSSQPALAPIFSELTPLRPPTGEALRRALVQPALSCGYQFEDDTLVDEMLADVRSERGALPLLAFAMSRLWDERDRERGRLTRDAYGEIGGVAGALAQHAETTLEAIGTERQSTVREIFRNLVTAQGTRAAREWDEILSIFDDRAAAETVLRELIDARLLTSYEQADETEDAPARRRVEIIHESLLTAWPRLVRWQTQDEDSAQLRDQLRQAAQMWEERGRPDDLLWTGTSFGEYQLWRERYAGGLSATEETFASAMVQRAGQKRRRRRIAVAMVIVILAVGLGVIEVFRRGAVEEARRAQAANLFTLGQLELADYPTAAVAYALKSLELTDRPEVRRFVVEALWRGPTAFEFAPPNGSADFSADGEWLAANPSFYSIWPATGGSPIEIDDEQSGKGENWVTRGPAPDTFVHFFPMADIPVARVRSASDPTSYREIELEAPFRPYLVDEGFRLITVENRTEDYVVRSWTLAETEPVLVGHLRIPTIPNSPYFVESCDVDPTGKWITYAQDHDVWLAPLADLSGRSARLVGRHTSPVVSAKFSPDGTRIASATRSGEIRVWSTTAGRDEPLFADVGAAGPFGHRFDRTGQKLVRHGPGDSVVWDLAAPPGSRPMELRSEVSAAQVNSAVFHPHGRWIATAEGEGFFIWPLARPYARMLHGHGNSKVGGLAISPDGKWIVSSSEDNTVQRWALSRASGSGGVVIYQGDDTTWDQSYSLGIDADSMYVLGSFTKGGTMRAIPLEGGPRKELALGTEAVRPAVDRKGLFAAWPEDGTVHVWDVRSEEVLELPLPTGSNRVTTVQDVESMPDGRLLLASDGELRAWNPESGTMETLVERTEDASVVQFDLSDDANHLLTCGGDWRNQFGPFCRGEIAVYRNLETGASWPLESHGDQILHLALDPSATLVATASIDGAVRVGPVTGATPHLLLGHENAVMRVAFLPDGQTIVSTGGDGTVRLWPVPEGRPFHTLPYEEFLERLRALTNLRVVEDPESSTGYKLEAETFPGWENLPTW